MLAEAKLEVPADQRPILGGRRGHHSEHLGHLLAVMQFLPRTYPDADLVAMAEHFHALRVAEIVPETDEANSIRFEVPAELREAFRFKAGQHLTLRADIGGEEVRRNYSLCTAPDDERLMVTVKRIAGGVFSNWVGDNLKAGDTIDVMPPHGSFTSEFDPPRQRPLCRLCRRLGDHAGDVADPDRAERRAATAASPCSTATATATRSSSSRRWRRSRTAIMGRLELYHFLAEEERRHRPVQRHARPGDAATRRSSIWSAIRRASTPGSSAAPGR